MPSLPLGVLQNVFLFLADPDKTVNACLKTHPDPLVACSLVSSSWRSACLPILWRFIDLTDPGTTSCEIEFFLQQSRELAELRTRQVISSNLYRQTYDYAQYIRGIVINIPSLCLATESAAAHRQKYDSILTILEMIGPVEKLRLEFNFNGSILPDSINISNMLASIHKKCSGLRFLKISTHNRIDEYLHPYLSSFVQQLSYPLTDFEIYGAVYVRFPPVSRASTLQSITLVPFEDWSLLDELPSLIWLWPNLRQLNVAGSTAAQPRFGHVIKAIIDSCPRLETLMIESGGNPDETITDEHLCRLVDACPNLVELRLSMILSNVTDYFIRHCAIRATRLQRLRLPVVHSVMGHGITNVSAWRYLQAIEIGPAQRRLDHIFVETVIRNCPKLRMFMLGDYNSFSSPTLQRLY